MRPVPPPACALTATRARSLSVELPGRDAFRVAVRRGALTLTPGPDPTRALVRVSAPLAFGAFADPADQPLELGVDAQLGAGGVEAAAGTRVLSLEATPRGIRGQLVLGRRDPTARRALELSVGPLALPCSVLRMRSPDDPEPTTVPPRRTAAAPLAMVREDPLIVRPVRIAPAELRVRRSSASSLFPVWVVDRHGDEVRVVVSFVDGSRLDGWTPASALRPPSVADAEWVERLAHVEVRESLGEDGVESVETWPSASSGTADAYEGEATLHAGAEVFAAPGEGRWATSAEELGVRVEWLPGASHARLLDVPGMWLDRSRAWVARDSLDLP